MAEEAQRSALIDQIWKLKRALHKEDGTYMHFKLCLDDPVYRNSVVADALEKNSARIRQIAMSVRAIDHGGPLTYARAEAANESNILGLNDTAEVKPGDASKPARPGTEMPWPTLAIAAAVLVAITASALLTGWHRGLVARLPGFGPTTELISGSIFEPTVWRAHTQYRLSGKVFVESGALLTIEAGTRIIGDPGSALIVTRDASITARGSADDPIVFTSAQPEGRRKPGDWGGLVLLGNAPVNQGLAQIEGIAEADSRGSFGGSDATSNCGVLEYVRIEFAGFEIGANNELNGLTLGGCGKATIVRYVQSHRGLDDGVEVFGGSVDLRHIVISGANDDGLDWDMGWTGRVQFLMVQQYPDIGDNGFEADNWKDRPDAEPRSRPSIYNVTMLGSGDAASDQRAMTIRRGSGGIFRNFVIRDFPVEAIDLRGDTVPALIDSRQLQFDHMVMHHIGAGGNTYFLPETGDNDDDAGFNEAAYFSRPEASILQGVDPLLSIGELDETGLSVIPRNDSPAMNGRAPRAQEEFWDKAADFMGAFRPGERRTWMAGWTAFPEH